MAKWLTYKDYAVGFLLASCKGCAVLQHVGKCELSGDCIRKRDLSGDCEQVHGVPGDVGRCAEHCG